MKLLAVVLLTALVTAGGVAQLSAGQDAIQRMRSASNAAIANSDTAGFGASLDDHFVVVTGNGSLLSREAYIAEFANDFADPHSVRFERVAHSIEISVPLTAEHGHWMGRVSGGPLLLSGTYLTMGRKGAGGWKLRVGGVCVAGLQGCGGVRRLKGRYAAAFLGILGELIQELQTERVTPILRVAFDLLRARYSDYSSGDMSGTRH